MSEFSMAEQLALFSQVQLLFGFHGAALANLLWMRPGAHVVELMARKDGNMCYFRLAGHVNVTHHLMLVNTSRQESGVQVNVSELREHLILSGAELSS